MTNIFIVLILFFVSAYLIEKYLSPKKITTKQDNAKLWLVRFTALYMLPVFSQLLNPTIAIVKEIGILGLLAPYLFVAIIVYGLGYFLYNQKNRNNVKNKKNKNQLYVLIALIVLLIAYIFADGNKHEIKNLMPAKTNSDVNSNNEVIKECNLFWDGFKFKLGKVDDSNYSSFKITYYEYTKVNFFIPKDMAAAFGVSDFDNKDDRLEKHPKFAQFLSKELFPIAPTLCSLSK